MKEIIIFTTGLYFWINIAIMTYQATHTELKLREKITVLLFWLIFYFIFE